MEMEVSISLHWLPGHLQCKEETIISILFFWGQGFFHSNNSSVRHYALIQKLIPGHKMKTVLMPNSLNSEIINILIYSHYATSSASTSILSICVWTGMKAHDSFTIVSYMYLILKMYFFQIFMNILDKSSEKFKSNQFKTLIIQNR